MKLINASTLSTRTETVSDTPLKLLIANRTYPLRVDSEQQSSLIKAAEVVNQRLKEYEKAFGVRDAQDLLAMCALHLASEQQGFDKEKVQMNEEISRELQQLTDLVKAFDKA